ncbi:hypothetical protein BDZ90DRAFT_232452 [Jaminaea rosea]|uniref:DUF3818 domain-containing protein n=1 Tax=Jaminaea rosea TaxID=1569628 RepID=A0A316UQ86_9BASI|nr:hypothetical protein BDZ90DRAFT_232452 [Jaminaea rosea]PWN27472.1 hypothetical protein BDZ90DRAFT_232452 [Jaminaea rosea]
MDDRKPNRRSIVASMGLEPRFQPEEPVSPPTWGPPPASPTESRKSRARKESTASRGTVKSTTGRKPRPAAVDAAPPGRVRAAGPATGSIKSRNSRHSMLPPSPAPPLPENSAPGAAGGGGTLGRSLTSKLFGRSGSAPAAEKKAAPPPEPAPQATTYESVNGAGSGEPGARSSMLFGLVGGGKDRVEPTPAVEGDSRRTRWNARNKTESVITAGFTDMHIGDEEDGVERQRPEKPLGLGRMSAKQAREKRTSKYVMPAIAEPEPEQQQPQPESQPKLALERHELVDDGPSLVKRKSSKASRKASTKARKNGAPQLPALSAIGLGGGLGSIIGKSKSAEPEYDQDEPAEDSELEGAAMPARGPSRIVEDTEDDEDFQEADDSAFPVTPATDRKAFLIPEENGSADPADVSDEDEVAPVLQREKHAGTAGAPITAADEDELDEEVPGYDEATARSAPAEKENGIGKKGLLAGAGLGAGLGGGLGALAGGSRSKASADKAQRSPIIPGAFGHHDDDEVEEDPARTVDDMSDYEDEDMIDEPPARTAMPAVAAVGSAAKAPKKVKRKEPKKDKKERKKDKAEPAAVAAPALAQPPERPQRSKARKPSSNREERLAAPAELTRQKSYSSNKSDEKKKKRGGLAALAGGAFAIGGASAAAKKGHKEDEPMDDADYEEYMDEPAVLSDEEGHSEADSEEIYRERSEKKKRSSKSQRSTGMAAASKPSRRSAAVKNLTPVQRHYLLKALVCLQMQLEWEELEKLGALTQYGYPFAPERPKLTRVKTELKNEFTTGEDMENEADDPYDEEDSDEARRLENLQDPLILRHLFQIHLRVFPGLDTAPLKFWQKRIQVFFDEMAARNFSTSVERGEYSKRRFYTLAMTRYLGGYFARGVGVRGQGELRGPGPGEKGSERWGVGKQWGKGTVKRGLDRPARIDSSLWKKIDNLFGDGPEGKVWRRAGKETTRIRGDWQSWKEQIIENETGLDETVNFLDISQIRNLPPKYRNAEEWARNHAAYLLHSLFVTAPNADSTFKVVRGIHTLFPYWGAKQLLKYANAQVLIEGILNLLLARPAGAKSLIQRIAAYVIGSEGTTLQKEYINPLKKAINDSELTGRIEEYVARGSRPEGRSVRAKADKTGDDVLTVILLSAGGTPLRREAQDRVVELQHSFARSPYRGCPELAYPADSSYAKENPDKMHVPKWDGSRTEEEEAVKFARLKLFLRDCLKKRDREQAVKMASGALVPTIIKDFLSTVMYDVIKQIASHADLSARLGDLQNFIDDMLDLKKKKDDSLQAWIALAARHENSLYLLVHECASIAGRFWEWCQIGLDYMALSTVDPVHPADRSQKNVEVNLEELLQDSRLSEKDVELILEEVDELAVYTKWSKVAYELEMRKNFLLARPDAATTSTLTEDDIPTSQMKDEIRDIDSLMRELMEAEGVPVDDGSLPNESRGTEARELATFWFDVMDPLGQHLMAEKGASELSYKPLNVSPPIPCLKYTRKALPVWREVLREKLPDWQHGDVNGPRKASNPGTRQRKGPGAAGPSNGSASASKKSKGLFR